MIRPRAPRAIRTRLLLVVVGLVAVVLAALTLAFKLVLARQLSLEADAAVRARAESELAALRMTGGHIRPPGARVARTLETRVWIWDGGRLIQSPPAPAGTRRAALALSSGPSRMVDVEAEEARLFSLPVMQDGRRIGTVVAALSLAPYHHTLLLALIGSCVVAALALVAVAGASAWTLRAALRPVDRMTDAAASWSEHDLDRRFGERGGDEIGRLAGTLDGLLDRIAASLRRERLFTAEVSHELRTPLAQIAAEAELALSRERDPAAYRASLGAVGAGAERLRTTLEALLATARAQAVPGRGTSDAGEAAARAAASCRPLAGTRRVTLVVDADPARAVRVGVEGELLQRILEPIVENACRYARGEVRVMLAGDEAGATILVADDGPGVTGAEREAIFAPGARGSAAATRPADDGAGLGLALARRLARSASGDVEVVPDPGGGRFLIRLPAG